MPIKGHQAGWRSRGETLVWQTLTGTAPQSIHLNGARLLRARWSTTARQQTGRLPPARVTWGVLIWSGYLAGKFLFNTKPSHWSNAHTWCAACSWVFKAWLKEAHLAPCFSFMVHANWVVFRSLCWAWTWQTALGVMAAQGSLSLPLMSRASEAAAN